MNVEFRFVPTSIAEHALHAFADGLDVLGEPLANRFRESVIDTLTCGRNDCRISGTGSLPAATAGEKVTVGAELRDAFLNVVTSPSILRIVSLSLQFGESNVGALNLSLVAGTSRRASLLVVTSCVLRSLDTANAFERRC